MSLRCHRAPVLPLIRHGGRVIDSPGLRFTSFPSQCRLLSLVVSFSYNSNTLPRKPSKILLSYNSERHACYTKRCLALDSNRALNVTKMSMRCRRRLTPSPNVPFLNAPCHSLNNSCLRDRADHNRVSNYHQTTLSLILFTQSAIIRPFMQILKIVSMV